MYRKRLYVFDGDTPREAVIRNYTKDDFADLIACSKKVSRPRFHRNYGGTNSSFTITSLCFRKERFASKSAGASSDR